MAAIHRLLLSLWIIGLYSCLNAQQLKSPCPYVFHYQQRDDSTDRWYGLMNVNFKTEVKGVTLKLTLNNPALELANTVGGVITHDYREYIIKNDEFRLKPNTSYLLRFYVIHDPSKPPPELMKIEQNGKMVCPDPERQISTKIFTSVFVNISSSVAKKPMEPTGDNEIHCGTIAAQASPLIFGGETAEVGKHPWHAVIYRIITPKRGFQGVCGGSLISKRYVLTTATCISELRSDEAAQPDTVQVHLGKHFLNNESSTAQVIQVSELVKHPKFNRNPGRNNNDIGLIKLKEPAVYNDFVRPICLWESDPDYELIVGQNGTIAGWGKTENSTSSNELKIARLRFASYKECLEKNPNFYLTRTTYCGAPVDGATCRGDGGGGMMYLNETSGRQVYYLRGISSFGYGKCGTEYYEVFTDVAVHLDFIKANTNQ